MPYHITLGSLVYFRVKSYSNGMKNRARIALLLLGDVVVLNAAFWSMLVIAFYNRLNRELVNKHAWPFAFLGLIWILTFYLFNLYNTQVNKPTIPHLRRIAVTFITASGISAIFFYTTPYFSITPKKNLIIFTLFALIFFIIWRRVFYGIFASYFRRKVFFISQSNTNESHIAELIKYIETYPQSGLIYSGVYNSTSKLSGENGVWVVSKEVWRDPKNFREIYNTKNEIMDLSYAYEDILGKVPLGAIDEGWIMHNVRSHKKKIHDVLERIISSLFAIFVLIVLSPLLFLAIILIKMEDGGRVFYTQKRVGRNGHLFDLYKFRSMRENAEENGAQWSLEGDPRVTRTGKVLRKIHLDEVPQMWNVIKGYMALVGPRPERPEFTEQLSNEIPFYHLRHIITPGFTGWAQIKFHYANSVMDSHEKFQYDLYYLKNRNIFMDLGILARTIQIIFTH